jgi:hypothetical protein
MLLSGMVGVAPAEADPRERFATNIAAIRERRHREAGAGVFVVFKATGEVERPDFTYRRDFADVAFCFDAFPKGFLRDKVRRYVTGTLALLAVALSANKPEGIQKVGEVTYLVDGERTIYSFTAEFGNATLIAARKMETAPIEFVQQHATRFLADQNLEKVARLLAASLDRSADRLRSFISTWSAFEIFVNTAFKQQYDAAWLARLSEGTPAAGRTYFERLRDVMKDKVRLADKFLIIASMLDEASAEDD